MSKKTNILEGYTVREIDSIIRSNKNIKEAAESLGITAQELYLFRSKNMKEFNKIKAEREQGLIVEDLAPVQAEKVQKVEAVEEAQDDTVQKHQEARDVLKAEHKEALAAISAELTQFKESNKTLQELIEHYQGEESTLKAQLEEAKEETYKAIDMLEKFKTKYKTLEKDKNEAEKQRKETERKALHLKSMMEKKTEKENRQALLMIEKKDKALTAAASEVERLRDVTDKHEAELRETIAMYEDKLRSLQQTLHTRQEEHTDSSIADQLEMAVYTNYLYFNKLKQLGAV